LPLYFSALPIRFFLILLRQNFVERRQLAGLPVQRLPHVVERLGQQGHLVAVRPRDGAGQIAGLLDLSAL
jgi:hypothetical protein